MHLALIGNWVFQQVFGYAKSLRKRKLHRQRLLTKYLFRVDTVFKSSVNSEKFSKQRTFVFFKQLLKNRHITLKA